MAPATLLALITRHVLYKQTSADHKQRTAGTFVRLWFARGTGIEPVTGLPLGHPGRIQSVMVLQTYEH